MLRRRLRPGIRPGPGWGAHDAPASSDSLIGWGVGYPLPNPHLLEAFGMSIFGEPIRIFFCIRPWHTQLLHDPSTHSWSSRICNASLCHHSDKAFVIADHVKTFNQSKTLCNAHLNWRPPCKNQICPRLLTYWLIAVAMTKHASAQPFYMNLLQLVLSSAWWRSCGRLSWLNCQLSSAR